MNNNPALPAVLAISSKISNIKITIEIRNDCIFGVFLSHGATAKILLDFDSQLRQGQICFVLAAPADSRTIDCNWEPKT